MSHPPGLIIVPCSESARWSLFEQHAANLDKPRGTRWTMTRSLNIAANMNKGVEQMLAGTYQWMMVMGDDHAFPDNYLTRLLDHNVQAVSSLVTNRQPPFKILAWDDEDDEGNLIPIDPKRLPTKGLHQVFAVGSAGLLVRRSVIVAMMNRNMAPLFHNSSGIKADEDIVFCRKLNEIGVPLFVDCSLPLGHIGSFIASPRPTDDGWKTEINFGDGEAILWG